MLFALGFSPIVRIIERQRFLPIAKRLPRWLAILILYLAILGTVALVLFLIFPPLVRQGQALWENLPEMFDRGQQFLIDKGWLKEHLTIREAVARAPGSGGDAVTKVLAAIGNVAGGIFGVVTILILTFYMLVDSDSLREQALLLFPRKHRARVDAASREAMVKVSAWLGGQLLLAGGHRRHVRGRSLGARHSLLLRAGALVGRGRDDSGRRSDPVRRSRDRRGVDGVDEGRRSS